MNFKKILCSVLAIAMILSTMGTVVFADDTTEVLQVGDTKYTATQVEEAITAWESTNNSTMTLLADVTLPRTIKINSTEYHVLDLGTYTMTISGTAIDIVNKGRSSASWTLDVKADSNNPGGIKAGTCIKTTGKSGVKDRPITRIYGGNLEGTAIKHSGSNGSNCPQFIIYDGKIGAINTNRAILQIFGGTFTGTNWISPDSTAYTLIAGGRFYDLKNNQNSALTSGKWTIGSDKGVFDRDIYVDKEGYFVVCKPEAQKPESFQAAVVFDFEKMASDTGMWKGYQHKQASFAFSSIATSSDKALWFANAEDAVNFSLNSVNNANVNYCTKIVLKSSLEKDIKVDTAYTIDATADGAAYYGNVKLNAADAKFIIKMQEDEEYIGEVTPYSGSGYVYCIDEVVENGIKTISYYSSKAVTPEASIGTTSFAKLQDAVDFAKTGDTVLMLNDVEGNLVFKSPVSTFVNNMRLASGATTYAADSINLDMNGKTLKGNVLVEAGAKANIFGNGTIDNADVNTGAIKAEGNVKLSNINVNSVADAIVVADTGAADIDGGNYNAGENFQAVVTQNGGVAGISGGTFSSNVATHTDYGYEVTQDEYGVYHVIQTDAVAGDSDVTTVATSVEVSLEYVADDKYNVVLNAPAGEKIHRFLSAELAVELTDVDSTETLSIKTVEGNKDLKIETIDPIYEQNDVWGFHLDENAEEITEDKIVIGTVVLTGVGTGKLNVVANTKNKVEAIQSVSGNIVKKYTAADSNLTLSATDNNLPVEVKKPTQKLTIQITFPNNIQENVKAYQDMTVTVNGKDITTQTYDMGSDTAYVLNDNMYVVEIDEILTKDHAYNIEVKGAGYRTANYRVIMTEDKTVYFWNDASKVKLPYEVGGKVITYANFLAGDIAEDNIIDKYDLAAVVSYFGRYGLDRNVANAYAKYDLNRDGNIDSEDIAYVLASFGY